MKRFFSYVLAMAMLFACCLGTANAAAPDSRASLTLSSYSAVLKAGSGRGELRISYSVTASKPAESVGVSSITIYTSNGSRVTTITGTTDNGLISTTSGGFSGTYSYTATSGSSYYADVVIFATAGGITDSRTVTTATVKAT